MPRPRVLVRTAILLTATLSLPRGTEAQSGVYVAGTLGFLSEPEDATPQHLGGTTWSGSALFGVHLSPRVGIEFEYAFGGKLHGKEYTYSPFRSGTVRVVPSGHDAFFTGQIRGKFRTFEPVAGLSYVRSQAMRHATYIPNGGTYFRDVWDENTVGLAAGLDAAFPVAPHFSVVPTFRTFLILRSSPSPSGTRVGGPPLVLRYGAGARVSF